MNCDMRYRNTEVSCDPVNIVTSNEVRMTGTRPSCPRKPMPMIDTPKESYISDYTKYLFIYPRDSQDSVIPYSGPYAVGTPGDASRTFQLFGNTSRGAKRLSSCTTQLRPPVPLADDAEWAKFIRLQVDNCANQYILNTAVGPFQKEAVETKRIYAMDANPFEPDAEGNPPDLSRKIDLESECQPLRMIRDTTNEYNVVEYLRWAWIKTLQDPEARKTTNLDTLITPRRSQAVAAGAAISYLTEDIGFRHPYDHEPHLPRHYEGGFPVGHILMDNTDAENIELPERLREGEHMSPSEISTVQYEEILDPTHPFSPRWDFLYADRDYSIWHTNSGGLSAARSIAVLTAGGPSAAIIAAFQVAGSQYMTQRGFENSTYCAGVKRAENENDVTRRKNLEVRVDVLSFRRAAYERALTRRATYNLICRYWTANFPSGTDAAWYVIPASFCYQITGYSFWPPFVYARDFDCWDCFGLSGNVDDESQHPPCTHNYLGRDLRMRRLPGGLNGFSINARCGTDMASICRDLRKPFTPINKLKMRYHHPADPDDSDGNNVVLKDGELEGLSFNDYFGNRMPYPRIWDLGQSLQRGATADSNDQPPLDTTGQYTSIVGVGREASAIVASNSTPADADGRRPADIYTDQRCKTMGWMGAPPTPFSEVSFGGMIIDVPDPLTSWTELKLYQARTSRNVGLSCIGRYEKVFKPGSAENLILSATGAEWQRTIITRCNRSSVGTVDKASCVFMTLQEYEDQGRPADTDTIVYFKQAKNELWPNAWRGYMSATDPENRFPNFGSVPAETLTGLDEAQVGDIILLPEGPRGPDAYKPGLAKLALVAEVRNQTNSTDCMAERNCFVKVLEPDGGKWPDVCGSTDTWGEMKVRYYFMPGHLPQQAADEYTRIASASHCGENKITHCVQTAWDNLEIYRIREDERAGCDHATARECSTE